MKKILSALLTLMLAVGLLTGCTDPKELYDNEDTIASGNTASEELNWAESKAYYGEAYLNQNVLYEKVYTWLVGHATIV